MSVSYIQFLSKIDLKLFYFRVAKYRILLRKADISKGSAKRCCLDEAIRLKDVVKGQK